MKFECQGKKSYDTKEDADREIFRMMYESYGGSPELRSYKCRYCGLWHLTSKIK